MESQEISEQIYDEVSKFLAGDGSTPQDDSSHGSGEIASSPLEVGKGRPAEDGVPTNVAEHFAPQPIDREGLWRPGIESPWGLPRPDMDVGSPWGLPVLADKKSGKASGSVGSWLANGAEQQGTDAATHPHPDMQLRHHAAGPGIAAQQPVQAGNTTAPFDEAVPVDAARAAIAKEAAMIASENARLQEENDLLRQRWQRERLRQENAFLQMELQQQQMQQQWQGPWAVPQHVLPQPGMMPPPPAYPPGTGLPPYSSRPEDKTDKFGTNISFASNSTALPLTTFNDPDPASFSSLSYSSSSMPSMIRSQADMPSEQGIFDPDIADENEPQTTRMMRNLPNNYTRKMLRKLLDSKGFTAKYDLLYLPIDFKRHANLGYAFINFVTEKDAEEFTTCFQNFSEWEHDSEKVCQITWSDTLQGQRAHIERYRSSPVMHESVPDEFKPILFKDGVRVPFPPPTKKIREPRQWPRRHQEKD